MSDPDKQPTERIPTLERLAELYGVEPRYRDSEGRWRQSPWESVLKVLAALGADLDDLPRQEQATRLLRAGTVDHLLASAVDSRRRALGRRLTEPVTIAWEGRAPTATLRVATGGTGIAPLGPGCTPRRIRATLRLEDGEAISHDIDVSRLRTRPPTDEYDLPAYLLTPRLWSPRARRSGARTYSKDDPGRHGRDRCLPFGYHRLYLEMGPVQTETMVISAPRRCWSPAQAWGLFAPTYALRGSHDKGVGDLADLETLCAHVGTAGGSVVATLPLLAAFLDKPFEPAPYRPVSRLFWNELFLDLARIPECQTLMETAGPTTGVYSQALDVHQRDAPLVDYREVMARKRTLLERSAEQFFSHGEDRRTEAFEAFLARSPEVTGYAAFRAEVEARGCDWREWPAGLAQVAEAAAEAPTDLTAQPTDAARRYHLYCQWQMEEQLSTMTDRRETAKLFLDLPVGVHPGGYDTWSRRDQFMFGLSTGAPPDAFFTLGQNWDSPPSHPERAREDGYRYFASCLRHAMRHASHLRVDHVMSLHRLYTIPVGAEPAGGVYVSYPAEELYAVLALESHRNRTVVVGEDLGTVPTGVRAALRRHGILRTWVFQAALRTRGDTPAGVIPPLSVASVNTHDMFPFAGFLMGGDIEARVETSQMKADDSGHAMQARKLLVSRLYRLLLPQTKEGTTSPLDLLKAVVTHMAESDAALVLVSLDDLLLETQPQNLPGTGPERPNWRRRVCASESDIEHVISLAGEWLRPGRQNTLSSTIMRHRSRE
jgi:4-alpha-glucanotransferase